MKIKRPTLFFILLFISSTSFVFGQKTVVINDPSIELKTTNISSVDENLIKEKALLKVRKKWVFSESPCEEAFEVSSVVKGSFSKPNSNQTLVFYSFCQTGNGLGNNGLVLIENGKLLGNYVTESGWTLGIKVLPDINQNGLNEFALSIIRAGCTRGKAEQVLISWKFRQTVSKQSVGLMPKPLPKQLISATKSASKPVKTPSFTGKNTSIKTKNGGNRENLLRSN
jgi:hypothetical protein